MKQMNFSNIVFYSTVIVLFIVEPIIGAFSQLGLGIFQLIIALKLKVDEDKLNQQTKRLINIYWISFLVWLVILILSIITSYIDTFFRLIVFVIPMIIGFNLVFVTYKSTKPQKA